MAQRIKVTLTGTYLPDPKNYLDENGVQLDPLETDKENSDVYGPDELVTMYFDNDIEVKFEYVDDVAE